MHTYLHYFSLSLSRSNLEQTYKSISDHKQKSKRQPQIMHQTGKAKGINYIPSWWLEQNRSKLPVRCDSCFSDIVTDYLVLRRQVAASYIGYFRFFCVNIRLIFSFKYSTEHSAEGKMTQVPQFLENRFVNMSGLQQQWLFWTSLSALSAVLSRFRGAHVRGRNGRQANTTRRSASR